MTNEFTAQDVDPVHCAWSTMVSETVEHVFTDREKSKLIGQAVEDDWAVPIAHQINDDDQRRYRASISGVKWYEAVGDDKFSNEGVAGVRKKIPLYQKKASEIALSTERWQREVWMHRSGVVNKANEELRRRGHRGQIAELLAYWRDENPNLALSPNLVVVTRRSLGVQLATLIANGAPLPQDEARRIFKNIAEFVAACHAVGLIIGDISQYNILVVYDEHGEFSHVDMCDLEFGDWADAPQGGAYGITDNVITELAVNQAVSYSADLAALAHRANFLFTGGLDDTYPYTCPKEPIEGADIPFSLHRLLAVASATTRTAAAIKNEQAVELATVEAFGTWVDHLTKRPGESKFEYVQRVVNACGTDHPWIIAGLVEWAKAVVPNPANRAWDDPSTPPAVLLVAQVITSSDPETAADLLGPVADFATVEDLRKWCDQAGLDHGVLAGPMRANHSVGKARLAEAFPESDAWRDAVERRPTPRRRAGRRVFGSGPWCDQVVARSRHLNQPDLAGSYSIEFTEEDDADGLAFEIDINGHLVELTPHPAARAEHTSTIPKRDLYHALLRDRRFRADMPDAVVALVNVAPDINEVQTFTKREPELEAREGVPRAPLLSRKFLSDKWLATFAEQSPREASPDIESGDFGVRIKDHPNLSFTVTVSSDGHIVSLRRGVTNRTKQSAQVSPGELWEALYLGKGNDGAVDARYPVTVLTTLGPAAKDVRSWTAWDKTLGAAPTSGSPRRAKNTRPKKNPDAASSGRTIPPRSKKTKEATKANPAGSVTDRLLNSRLMQRASASAEATGNTALDALAALFRALVIVVGAPVRLARMTLGAWNASLLKAGPSYAPIGAGIISGVVVTYSVAAHFGWKPGDETPEISGLAAVVLASTYGWSALPAKATPDTAVSATAALHLGLYLGAWHVGAMNAWLLIIPILFLVAVVHRAFGRTSSAWLARTAAYLMIVIGLVAATSMTGLAGAFAPNLAAATASVDDLYVRSSLRTDWRPAAVGDHTIVSYGPGNASPHIATAAARFDADHGTTRVGPVVVRGGSPIEASPLAHFTEIVEIPADDEAGTAAETLVSTDFTFKVTKSSPGLGDLTGRLAVVAVYEHPDDEVHGTWLCPTRLCGTVEAATSVPWNLQERGFDTGTARHPVSFSVAPLSTTVSRDGERFNDREGRVTLTEGDHVYGYALWPEIQTSGPRRSVLRVLGVALLDEPFSAYPSVGRLWNAEWTATRSVPADAITYLMDGDGMFSLGEFNPGTRVEDPEALQESLQLGWTPGEVDEG